MKIGLKNKDMMIFKNGGKKRGHGDGHLGS